MKTSKIEIKRNQLSGIVEIFLDGNKVRGIRSFELKEDITTKCPVLTLELNALDFSVDCLCVSKLKGYDDYDFVIKPGHLIDENGKALN